MASRDAHVSLLAAAAAAAASLLVLAHRRQQRAEDSACKPCDMPDDQEMKTPPRRSAGTPRRALLGDDDEHIGMSSDPAAPRKRDCYIGWDDYFMSVAVLSAFRSKDPNRQVGACVVSPKTLRIVGIGYNGFPWGCDDDDLPWAKVADSPLDTKYPYVCHAEMNAILNKNCESLHGCRMYVTLFPCNECAKLIIQSRISEVVFISNRRDRSPLHARAIRTPCSRHARAMHAPCSLCRYHATESMRNTKYSLVLWLCSIYHAHYAGTTPPSR